MTSGQKKDGKYWYRHMVKDVELISSQTSRSTPLREFSELTSVEAQIKFHLKSLQKENASIDMVTQRVKNNEKAERFRKDGNHAFSTKVDPAKVAELYTQSIAYALPGCREIAFAYASRSAASYTDENYEDCLLDIERALENDYPVEMSAKLHARKVRCLVALKRSTSEIQSALKDTRESLLNMDQGASARNLVEKTLTDKNHMAPHKSKIFGFKKFFRPKKQFLVKPTVQDDTCDIPGATGITVQYSEKYGRHLVATRDIRPGEIIAMVDTYANARAPKKCYRECAQCTRPTRVGIPCDHCPNVVYCSTSCRDKAWRNYHVAECPILGVLLDLEIPVNSLLGVRITLKALQEAGGVKELKEMVETIDSVSDPRTKGFTGGVLDCAKYACIYTLTSHSGKHMIHDSFFITVITTMVIYYLATITEIFGCKFDRNLKIFNEPLVMFLAELMIKNCEIVQVTGLSDAPSKGGEQYDVVLAPYTGLCNHSCSPNMVYFGDNKSAAIAIQPIKKGEQIWDNYLRLHYSKVPKSRRQKLLKRYYLFTCECIACVKNWPMYQQLPRVSEIPGLSAAIRAHIAEAEQTFSLKNNIGLIEGEVMSGKDQLADLLKILHRYAFPSKEMADYQEHMIKMCGTGIDTF